MLCARPVIAAAAAAVLFTACDKKAAEPPAEPAGATGDGTAQTTPAREIGDVEPTYALKPERPFAVGDRYRLTSTGTNTMRFTANGHLLAKESESFTWEYEADVTVKAISANGQPTAEEHQVTRLVVVLDGDGPPIAQPKVVAGAIENDVEAFSVDGKPADARMTNVLAAITDLDDGTKLDTNAVFGATGAMKIGDTWKVNSKAMADGWGSKFADSLMPAKAENITGTVSLTEATTIEGIAALRYSAEVAVEDAAPKMGEIVPTAGTVRLTVDGWTPINPTSTAGSGTTKTLAMHIEGDLTRDDGILRLVINATIQGTETRIALD